MRLVFMGTPDFAVPALRALIEAGHAIAAVYSQPPRPAGRGQREQRSPVHEFAMARGIEVRTPKSLKGETEQTEFAALGADAAVVVAYGLILPKPVLSAPKYGCFNIHASLLPRWRGASPIQRALLAGDAETGVTIMRMDEGLDTGPMLLREATPIGRADTGQTLHDRLSAMGGRLVVEALARLDALTPQAQPEEGVTYAAKLSKDEGRLDWTKPAAALERQVRAFDPWPGAWFEHRGERIKVLRAGVVGAAGRPGSVIDGAATVACGEGALQLLRLQRPGKGPLAAADFLRGFALPAGTALG